MLKTSFHKLLWCMLILGIGGFAWAAGVTSNPVSTVASLNQIQFPLDLKSTTPVAGLNGEFQYDPAFFSEPKIMAASGAEGFIVLGNLVSPGHFKFVIYSDPVKTLKLDKTVAMFQVTVTGNKPAKSTISTIQYVSPAASDASAKSLATTLSNIQVKIANGATDWALYE